MTGWAAALPHLAAAVFALFLPGALLLLGAGAPWRRAVAFAPAPSVGLVACTAVAGDLAGLRFGALLVAAASIGAAGVLALTRLGARRLRAAPAAPETDPAGSRGRRHRSPRDRALLDAVALACSLLTWRLGTALGGPDRISQTFDAVFHLNTTRYIVDSGVGSSLRMAGWATDSGGFYPAAWHDLAALAAVDGNVVAATQALGLVVGAVVWPLSMLVLVRRLLGQRWIVLLGTGALLGGLGVFPARMLDYGVLYPFLLGIALMPALVAVAHVATGPRASRGDFRGLPLWLTAGLGTAGLALAHTGALLAFALLALPVAVRGGWRVGRARWAGGRWISTAVAGTLALAALLAAVVVLDESPMIAAMRQTNWRTIGTASQAFGSWLMISPHLWPVPWAIAGLVLVGIGVAVTARGLRWLVVAHGLLAVPYVFAAGVDSELSLRLTGFWYNDGVRLGALLPLTALPLAAVGLAWLAGQVRRRGAPLAARVSRTPLHGRLLPVAALLATAGLVVGTLDASSAAMYQALEKRYVVKERAAPRTLLTASEWELLEQLPDLVPPGTVVAGNPWDGSGLAYAISGVEVLVPQLGARPTGDAKIVAEGLARAHAEPEVCRAARDLGVGYALDFGPIFWPGDGRARSYPGLDRMFGSPALELVASVGHAQLYRLTACGVAP